MSGTPIHTVDDTAARLDVRVTKGKTWVMPMAFTRDDGTPVDLTGLTLTFDIFRGEDDETPVESATVTVLDAASGLVQVSLDAATLGGMDGTYWHSCDVTDGTVIGAVLGGAFYVEKGVPR